MKHPAGSLEAAVGSARRRNVLISGGILGLLAASMVMLVVSTRRSQQLARQQMDAFGTVVSFDLGTRQCAESFLGALTLVREATSFGGVHSTAERRARWGGDAVGEGFIRFSVGCETADDLLEDVDRALASARDAGRAHSGAR